MVDADDNIYELPSSISNTFGCGLDFDECGRADGLGIGWSAIADHLEALRKAGRKHGVRVRRVLFYPPYQQMLDTELKNQRVYVRFNRRGFPSWRHDEHYHVEFAVGR